MKQNMEISRLVERAKSGDAEAFARIYTLYSKRVYYIALGLLGSEQDAKDILQEVMLRLYKSLPSLRNTRALYSFICTTTHNCCVNLIQKNNTLLLDDESDEALELHPEQNPEFIPEEYVHIQERKDMVIGMVEDLSPALRLVVLQYYFNGMSTRQIADLLETNEATVRTRLFRARSTLKAKLDAQLVKEGVLKAMAIPVLTQILNDDADAVFGSEISVQVWKHIGAELGFTATTIASTCAAVTTVPSVSATATFAGEGVILSTGSKVALLLATAATVATMAVHTQIIAPNPIPLAEGYFISGHDSGDDSNSMYAPADPDGAYNLPRDPGSSEFPLGLDSAEATTSAEYPGSNSQRTQIPQVAQVTVERTTLHYAAGTQITDATVLRDSGAKLGDFTDATGLSVAGLDEVDVDKPGRYAVLLKPEGTGEEHPLRVAVVIIIE